MTFAHQVRVRYSEVDNQGVVYNSRYLEYVDHAITMWLRSLGLIYEDVRESQWDFALRHAEVDWITPARADEVLDVTIELMSSGNSSFKVLSEVRRPGEDALFRMRVIYVGLDPATGGSAPLPDFVRDRLESS
jgi:acyl-CoA thioester hydrolase